MVILEGPLGRRYIQEGVSYRKLPGEKVIDSTQKEKFKKRSAVMSDRFVSLEKEAVKRGIGAGDLIAKLTTYFGIKPCKSCEQRRQVFNQLSIRNWKIEWNALKK